MVQCRVAAGDARDHSLYVDNQWVDRSVLVDQPPHDRFAAGAVVSGDGGDPPTSRKNTEGDGLVFQRHESSVLDAGCVDEPQTIWVENEWRAVVVPRDDRQ